MLDRLRSEERGTIVVLVALTMTAIMIISAIAVDGGAAYAERRRMQNAADAAATAGAWTLDGAKLAGTASAAEVAQTVEEVAGRNGADAVTCAIITWDGGDIGPCDATAVADPGAAGVRVGTSSTRPTAFGRVAGQDTMTVSTRAAATIQPVVGITSPFVICGGDLDGGYDFLDENGKVDAAAAEALGEIAVHGSQVPECQAGSQMKGLNDSEAVTVGTWIDPAQGRRVGQYRNVVAGGVACSGDQTDDQLDGCDVVIPIANRGVCCGASAQLHVSDFAVFRVRYSKTGTVTHFATFQRTLDHLTDAVGGVGTVSDPDDLRVIKLVE